MRPRLKKRRAAQRNRSWAFNVLAPWAIGVGALVSFTADAGQDSARDWNIAPLTARIRASRALEEQQAINFSAAATGELSEVKFTQPLIKEAELSLNGNERAEIGLEENEPHADLKGNTQEFPLVDRRHRGDPTISVHPNLASQSSSIREGDEDPLLTFSIEGTNGRLAQMPLAPRAAVPGDEIFEFEVPEAIPSTTQKTTAAASPPQTSAVATSPTEAPKEARESFDKKLASQSYGENRQEASSTFANERTLHGATPQISRAIALGSSTPAQPDSTPIEVSAFPSATLALSAPEKRSQKNYSAFIKPEKLDREKRCLAEAVYFESRSETETGQAAVAQVVLNRVNSGLYPSSICGVVYQNRHHYKACQFSFACEGRSLRITEHSAWITAVRIANEVMEGRTYISDVGHSTHYHTNYVRPRWARALTKMDVIGRHIFYKLKPGQT